MDDEEVVGGGIEEEAWDESRCPFCDLILGLAELDEHIYSEHE